MSHIIKRENPTNRLSDPPKFERNVKWSTASSSVTNVISLFAKISLNPIKQQIMHFVSSVVKNVNQNATIYVMDQY